MCDRPNVYARLRSFAITTLLTAVVAATPAAANGRYPGAKNLVIGPPGAATTIAMQTTFGVVISRDSGRTFHWVCETGLGFSGTWDPTLALTRNGTLVAALPDGLSTARPDYCNFMRPATGPTDSVIDLAHDPDSDRVVSALAPLGRPNGIALSDDDGVSWRNGWAEADFFIETVDFARGNPMRMYVSGYGRGGAAVLYRSDDGGATFSEATRNFGGGFNAFIAAVDPMRADVLYVRSDLPAGGTLLLRSDDGGRTLREVVRTSRRMTAMTISPDGRSLWVGSPFDGVRRSTDEGARWETVSNQFSVLCMRYQAGLLFACADEATDGFSLACSTDEGRHFVPIMSFSHVLPPDNCPAGSAVADQCNPLWPALHATLTADAGVQHPPPGTHNYDAAYDDPGDAVNAPEAGVDAAAAMDVPVIDSGVRDAPGASEMSGPGRCGCTIVGLRPSRRALTIAVMLACVAMVRRRKSGYSARRKSTRARAA